MKWLGLKLNAIILETNMLMKGLYTVSLWALEDSNVTPPRIEVQVESVTAGEAMKMAESRNPGYEAIGARCQAID